VGFVILKFVKFIKFTTVSADEIILTRARSAVGQMGDHLAAIDMGRKVWGGWAAVPLSVGGSWVPI